MIDQVGMHHIMGGDVQDYGLSQEAAIAFQILVEREWELEASDAD
jgi:hypothetical protein